MIVAETIDTDIRAAEDIGEHQTCIIHQLSLMNGSVEISSPLCGFGGRVDYHGSFLVFDGTDSDLSRRLLNPSSP